jgi:hypothetical protein
MVLLLLQQVKQEHKLLDLSPLTLYSFGVSAVDAEGNESGISTLQVTTGEDETPDTTPPTAPGNLDGTAGAHSVLLFWEASTDDREVKGMSCQSMDLSMILCQQCHFCIG